jgi:hypothetical protein
MLAQVPSQSTVFHKRHVREILRYFLSAIFRNENHLQPRNSGYKIDFGVDFVRNLFECVLCLKSRRIDNDCPATWPVISGGMAGVIVFQWECVNNFIKELFSIAKWRA